MTTTTAHVARRKGSNHAKLLHQTRPGSLLSIACKGLKPSVHRACRRRAWAQDPGSDLETVVERNVFVEQKLCGGLVALRRVDAPALLLPADEWRACLFHDASLADCLLARLVRVMRRLLWLTGDRTEQAAESVG
jgi:hypothetical protein